MIGPMAASRLHHDSAPTELARRAFRALMQTERFEKLLTRLSTLAHRELPARTTFERIASADAKMNARALSILRARAADNRSATFESMGDAVVQLGHEACVRACVLAAYEALCDAALPGSGLKRELFLRHALATATGLRRVGELAGLDAHTGWVVGLLHNIGAVIIAAIDPSQHSVACAVLAGSGSQLSDAERLTFQYTHSDMGSVLGAELPWHPALVEAISKHHDGASAPPIAQAVGACSVIGHQLGFDMGLANTSTALTQSELIRFALVGNELERVVADILTAVSAYDLCS